MIQNVQNGRIRRELHPRGAPALNLLEWLEAPRLAKVGRVIDAAHVARGEQLGAVERAERWREKCAAATRAARLPLRRRGQKPPRLQRLDGGRHKRYHFHISTPFERQALRYCS